MPVAHYLLSGISWLKLQPLFVRIIQWVIPCHNPGNNCVSDFMEGPEFPDAMDKVVCAM